MERELNERNLGVWVDCSYFSSEELDIQTIRITNRLARLFGIGDEMFVESDDVDENYYTAQDAINFCNDEICGNRKRCVSPNYQFVIEDNSLYLMDTEGEN